MGSLSEGNALTVQLSRALALSFLVVLMAGCDVRSEASQADMAVPEVEVADVLVESVTVTETFNGRLEAPEHVQLRPRVSGYIQAVTFEEGAWVEAGDLLFQIDPRPYEARVRSARADLEQARSELALAGSESRRAERLLESQAISREEYDQRYSALANAQARVNAAEAGVDTAELDLEYTRIIAPVDGRAGRALVTKGNLANADQTVLTTVVSVQPLHVYFDSNEAASTSGRALVDPAGGTQVRVGLGSDAGLPYRGELDYIGNTFNAGTGTLQYRAVLDNPDGALRPGQFARVEMPVERLEGAILVRRQAVLTNQDRRYVYIVDENNTVSHREVTPGRQVDNLTVIEAGLQGGERVVVNGMQKIFGAGMQIAPQRVAMREDPDADNSVLASAAP